MNYIFNFWIKLIDDKKEKGKKKEHHAIETRRHKVKGGISLFPNNFSLPILITINKGTFHKCYFDKVEGHQL